MNLPEQSQPSGRVDERVIERLMDRALERFEADSDLTLSFVNQDENKCLNAILPHLFVTSKTGPAQLAKTEYYNGILQAMHNHLSDRQDPSLCLYGAVSLLTRICEAEPNVNKRLVSDLYERLRHQTEEQFVPLFLDLSTKETAIQAVQEADQQHNGYDESKQLSLQLNRFQRQLSMLLDFGQKYHDKFLSTYGVGVSEDLLAKQAKMLFEHQFKNEIFFE